MKYFHALNKIDGIGPKKLAILKERFGDWKTVWNASENDLAGCGIGRKAAYGIESARKVIDPDKEWELIERDRIEIIAIDSERYPKKLKEIPSAPYALYVRGSLDLNSVPMISIVGSRNLSAYGTEAAGKLARELAECGFCVVSGLAIGIDAIAHRGALDVSGKTAAVLGSSVDDRNVSPRANFRLAQEIIASGGAILSDYPPETGSDRFTFPARNRIVAGLSLGTLVVEAGEKSGALITARLALEFGREVFAVPGSIFSPVSAGTNRLIKDGARITLSASDILEEFEYLVAKRSAEREKPKADTPEEALVIRHLTSEPLHVDKLSRLTRLDTPTLSSILSMMEIKGSIRNAGGRNYVIA